MRTQRLDLLGQIAAAHVQNFMVEAMRLEAELEELEAELAAARADSARDELTGLGNRVALRGLQSEPATWVALDLDGFKSAQDAHPDGHAAGDRVLVDFAAWLRHSTRAGDSIFRVGGDEFLVALHRTEDSKAFALRAATWSYPLGDHTVTTSVGIGRTWAEADAACYEDKKVRGQG